MNDWGIVNTATLHNAAGNQVKLPNVAGTQLYNVVYDSLNRLRELRNTANTSTVALFDYDALGRRVLFYDNKTPEFSRWYYYDGVNEILEAADSGATVLRWYVHGVSYIDERLMMHAEYDPTGENEVDRSYYYAIDRMYNVRYLLDAAGAIVESYAYDPYGKPLIRECAGRGDMTGDSVVNKFGDSGLFDDALACNTFDPRADVDDDGDVDRDDAGLSEAKSAIWDGTGPSPVKTARSLIGNPYMFQGRPHFVASTDYVAEHATLMLNDHRNRFADPMTGRWLTRDPIGYKSGLGIFEFVRSNPIQFVDADGFEPVTLATGTAAAAAASGGAAAPAAIFIPPVVIIGVAGVVVIDEIDDYLEWRALGQKLERDKKRREQQLLQAEKQRKRQPKPAPAPEPRKDPGDCTEKQRNELQDDVERICDDLPGRGCKPGMSCDELADRVQRNRDCAAARKRVNEICYGGGDRGHRRAVGEAYKAEANCWILIANHEPPCSDELVKRLSDESRGKPSTSRCGK